MGIFSGVGDFLFGSKGEPARAEDVTPREFRDLRNPLATALQGLFPAQGVQGNQALGNIPQFQGQFAAPATGRERQLMGQIFGQTRGQSPLAGASQGVLQQTLGGQFLRPESNPFLQATIEAATRPVTEAFQEQVLPNLRAQFTNAGQMIQPEGSSPFAQSLAQVGRDFTRTIGDISSRLAGENFQAERQRQQQAVGQGIQLDRSQLQNSIAGLQAVALPRLIEQRGIDQGLGEFNRRIQTLLQVLQTAGAVTSPNTVQFPGTPGQPGILGQVASGIGGGFAGPFGAAAGDAAASIFRS